MKKSKMIGIAAVSLSAGLLLAACSSSNASGSSDSSGGVPSGVKLPAARVKATSSAPAWKQDTKKAKTLTWFVDQTWWNVNWGQDAVTKQIEKELNIKINFVVGDDTKLNTYFAGGNLPDIITNDSMTNQAAQTANKWALPLQTLASKYDPYFNTVASSQTLDWYKLSNGYSYGYPGFSNTSADYSSGNIKPEEGFVIQKSIYDALGQPKMDTPADFVKVEKEIKAKYPKDITMGFTDLATTVQDLAGVPYYKDGKYYDRNTDSGYLTWLDAIRQVHQAGGISDNDFSNNASTLFQQNLSSGKYATAIVGGAINQAASLQQWNSAHPADQYIVVNAITPLNGLKPDLSQAGISGWLGNYITKDCKDPEAAIELFTYLLSEEGQITTTYGVEGQTYTKDSSGQIKIMPAIKDLTTNNPTKAAQEYGMPDQFALFGHDKYKALDPTDSYSPALTTFFDWGKGLLTPEFPTENVAPKTGTIQATNYLAIQNNWTTENIALVRATSESQFNSIVSQYKSFQNSHGWSAIQSSLNSQVQANLKKLNMSSTASTPNK